MKEQPVRKNIRLEGYDYSQAGYYFITICVKDGQEALSKIHVGANCVRPQLTEPGRIVETEIAVLSATYEGIYVDQYVIMPNHIHIILSITQKSGRTQCAPTISRAIKQFKGAVTKRIGYSLWQKSYHDHIIRDEADYQRIEQYIDENPAKWQEDRYYSEP